MGRDLGVSVARQRPKPNADMARIANGAAVDRRTACRAKSPERAGRGFEFSNLVSPGEQVIAFDGYWNVRGKRSPVGSLAEFAITQAGFAELSVHLELHTSA
jgi:hypothetical protein